MYILCIKLCCVLTAKYIYIYIYIYTLYSVHISVRLSFFTMKVMLGYVRLG